MPQQLPRDVWVLLDEAAVLAARLSDIPIQVTRERVVRATWECKIPVQVADTGYDNWHAVGELEGPISEGDINIQESSFSSKSLSVKHIEEGNPFSLQLMSRTLSARINWPALFERYFPEIDYRRLKSRRTGRPQKHDWAAFEREAGKWIYLNGFPLLQADLEKYMADWCQLVWGDDGPVESTIRARVVSILEEHRQAIEAGN